MFIYPNKYRYKRPQVCSINKHNLIYHIIYYHKPENVCFRKQKHIDLGILNVFFIEMFKRN